MAKLIKYLLIGIPILIIVIIVVLYFSVNSIIKSGVETIGPKVLGADVRLQKANISLFSGKGQLKGIIIGNPKGFHTKNSFKLNEVRVAMDVYSLLSDKIIIDEIFINEPEITYETSGKSNNIKEILNNVRAFAGESKSTAQKETKDDSKKKEKNVQINNFIVKNGKVNMSVTLLKGEGVSLPLSDIHMKDIGKEGEGASLSEAMKGIFVALNKNIANSVAGSVKSVGKGVEKSLDKLKGLFGK